MWQICFCPLLNIITLYQTEQHSRLRSHPKVLVCCQCLFELSPPNKKGNWVITVKIFENWPRLKLPKNLPSKCHLKGFLTKSMSLTMFPLKVKNRILNQPLKNCVDIYIPLSKSPIPFHSITNPKCFWPATNIHWIQHFWHVSLAIQNPKYWPICCSSFWPKLRLLSWLQV